MSVSTFKLNYERHTFHHDKLLIQPVHNSMSQAPSQRGPLYVHLHTGELTLHTGSYDGKELASAKFPTKESAMRIKIGGQKIRLSHSWVQVNSYGQSTIQPKPSKSWWSGKVKDGSIGCYCATLPNGAGIRWEGSNKKDVKMSCVTVDPQGRSTGIVGELLTSNDVIRLINVGDNASSLAICVLLGFICLFERARARDKKKAEAHTKISFEAANFIMDGAGGDGGGGGGDGGGGGGDGGGGGGGS